MLEQLSELSYTSSALGGYIFDHDSDFLYVKTYDSDKGCDVQYRIPFDFIDGQIVPDPSDAEPVIKDTAYLATSKDLILKELSGLNKFLTKHFSSPSEIPVVKQFREKEMVVHEPLYIAYGEVDGHGDTYLEESTVHDLVKELKDSRDKGVLQTALFHKHKTESFEVVDAYVTLEKTLIGDQEVPRLQPVAVIKFNSEKMFNARIEGKLTGLSIGAIGSTVSDSLMKSVFADQPEMLIDGAVRYIKKFKMSHRNAHLSYTDPSAGGAASLKNEFYLAKSMDSNSLTLHQKALLEDVLEEEFTELDKQKNKSDSVDNKTPSTSGSSEEADSGVDNQNLNKGKNTDMSDKEKQEVVELREQLKAVELKLKASAIEKSLTKYQLTSEVVEGLASALVELEENSQTAITKSLDLLLEVKETEISDLKKHLDKSAESEEEDLLDNSLIKQLGKEHGSSEDVSAPAKKKTLAERVSEKIKQPK